MTFMDVLTVISLIASVVSIVLAVVAMTTSKAAERESKMNFEKTQQMLSDTHEKTKDLLHQIDLKSAVINDVVQKNQTQLTTLFSNVLDKVLQPNIEESVSRTQEDSNVQQENQQSLSAQMAMQLLPELIRNPDSLSKLVEISEKIKKR